MFTRSFIVEVRRKALRRGVWFKALDRVERGIISLVIRVVDRVESAVLGVVLVKIVRKLRDALKSGFVERMEKFGLMQARRLAKHAMEWGYQAARSWASDLRFAKFLTLIDMNESPGFASTHVSIAKG